MPPRDRSPAAPYRATECIICETPIEQKRTGRPRWTCGLKCRRAARGVGWTSPVITPDIEPPTCDCCYAVMLGARQNQRWCSPECRRIGQGYGPKPVAEVACAECGAPCTRRGIESRVVCSTKCRKRRDRRRRRGSYVSGKHEVLLEHGDRCGICEAPVDVDLPHGSRRSPVVDHVLAVALGGTNDIENLRLAHSICNSYKGIDEHRRTRIDRGEIPAIAL